MRLYWFVPALCAAFVGLEAVLAHLPLAQLESSMRGVSGGPFALEPAQLMDRLQEWRAHRPELSDLVANLVASGLIFALFKHLAFPTALLSGLLATREGFASALGRLAGPVLAQTLYAMPLRILLAVGIGVSILGLEGDDPYAYYALILLWLLWGALHTSLSVAHVRLSRGRHRYAPSHLGRGLLAWMTRPGPMIFAWLLWLAQMAFALAPVALQIYQAPGPSAAWIPWPFCTASLGCWALMFVWLDRTGAGETRRHLPEHDDL